MKVLGGTAQLGTTLDVFPPQEQGRIATRTRIEEPLKCRIVDCAPESIAIGMEVGVRFVARDGYWIPVFAPVAAPA